MEEKKSKAQADEAKRQRRIEKEKDAEHQRKH